MSQEGDTPTDAAPAADVVPRARLSEVIAERNEARQALEALRGELDPLRAKVEELSPFQAQVEELQGQLSSVRALSAAGIIDEEGQAVAGMLYDRVQDKPEGGLAGWLSAMRETPDKAPRPLRPYLHPAEAAPASKAPPTARPAAAAPDPNRTAVEPASGVLSAEALAEARRRLARGDRSALAEIKRHFERRRS